jgi:hypothetical protein
MLMTSSFSLILFFTLCGLVVITLPPITLAYHAVKVPIIVPAETTTDANTNSDSLPEAIKTYAYYLVHRGTIRQLPDLDTVKTLGFSLDHIEEISHKTLREFKRGPMVEEVKQKDGSPDEIMRIELLRNKILQGRLIQNITYIGEYINPSVVPFCGRLFMAVGLAWGFNDGQAANEHLEFRWLNHSKIRPIYDKDDYYGVGWKLDALDVPIIGQDPRMISTYSSSQAKEKALERMRERQRRALKSSSASSSSSSSSSKWSMQDEESIFEHDKIFITFTYRYSKPVSMGMAELLCNHVTQTVNVTRYDITFKYYQEPYSDQKNWSPFLYQDEMLWIQRINPFTVTQPFRPENTAAEKYAKVLSTEPRLGNLPWKHGELRGGTNAVFLGDKYLAFFHSSTHIPGNGLTTYIFGAYTFTAQPPFKLIAMSPLPLMDETLYTGAWDPLKNRHIDYVAFPSTCFIKGDEIVMSFGWQDHMGMTATFKLKHLLQTLEPVGSFAEGGSDASNFEEDNFSAEDLPATTKQRSAKEGHHTKVKVRRNRRH